MPCTTLLVGKKATFDGSTMIARNEDSGGTGFAPKKFIVVKPEDQPRQYVSVISKVKIDLPDDPMRYTAMPNADPSEGNWSAAGVNTAGVSMTATETLTTNERVLSGDPFEKGGIGEEDIVTLVLPYIRSAREGVERLGMLLETYGTYEMNGIAFSDLDEVWWLETIGGHHWIARRVPDDCYAVAPNYFNLDEFDLEDALGEQKEHMASADLKEFIAENHLDLSFEGDPFDARQAFGSHSDADHVYNTPRSWYIERYFNNHTYFWDGPHADFTPRSDDIPFCMAPERKVTVEDVKYVLSAHYQGTTYDPYASSSEPLHKGELRPIGINRNNFLSLTQIRPDKPEPIRILEWVTMGSNVFNAFVPFYANVDKTPEYFANTTVKVTTESFYWANRIIAAMADASYAKCKAHIERYQLAVQAEGWKIIKETDKQFEALKHKTNATAIRMQEKANERIAAMVREKTDDLLDKVLRERSNQMKNAYARADA
ncbi:MAG: C69 family dipeptidase [Firmicutes bacterium]|nr:C69 family dipeptidase [Bacillota bacterium]